MVCAFSDCGPDSRASISTSPTATSGGLEMHCAMDMAASPFSSGDSVGPFRARQLLEFNGRHGPYSGPGLGIHKSKFTQAQHKMVMKHCLWVGFAAPRTANRIRDGIQRLPLEVAAAKSMAESNVRHQATRRGMSRQHPKCTGPPSSRRLGIQPLLTQTLKVTIVAAFGIRSSAFALFR